MPAQGVDLRLLPAAVVSWVACAVGVGLDAATAARSAALFGLLGCLVPVAVLALRRRAGTTAGLRGRHGRTAGRPPSPPPGTLTATVVVTVAAASCALVSCAAQLHLRQAGELGRWVEQTAVVGLVGVVRSEPAPLVAPWEAAGEGSEMAEDERGDAAARRWRVVLAVQEAAGRGALTSASADVVVLGGSAWGDVAYGTRVEVVGRLRPAEPGDRMIAYLTTSQDPVVRDPPGPVDRRVEQIRSALLDVTQGLPPDARGLVPGAAIGDTRRLPADLEQAMRDVSLTHITAVSGAHFAVLSASVLVLTSAVRMPTVLRAATSAAVMVGFVLLVHPEPSVVRAAAMGSLGVLGMLLGRPSRAAPALGAAVVTLLVLDPWLARSYGFVLSVLATGSIVLLAPRLAAIIPGTPGRLGMLLAVPVAAQAACGPVLVLLDPVVPVYAVPANLLATPALLPATLLGVAAALAAPWFPAAGTVLAQLAAGATWWISFVARTAAALPGATYGWAGGPGGAAVLAVVTIGVLALVLHLGRRRRDTA